MKKLLTEMNLPKDTIEKISAMILKKLLADKAKKELINTKNK